METVVAGFVLGAVRVGCRIGRIGQRASSTELSRNAIVGIRTSPTVTSEQAWLALPIVVPKSPPVWVRRSAWPLASAPWRSLCWC